MQPEDILRLKEITTADKLQSLENEQTSLLKEIDRSLRVKLLTPSVANIKLLKAIVNQIKN